MKYEIIVPAAGMNGRRNPAYMQFWRDVDFSCENVTAEEHDEAASMTLGKQLEFIAEWVEEQKKLPNSRNFDCIPVLPLVVLSKIYQNGAMVDATNDYAKLLIATVMADNVSARTLEAQIRMVFDETKRSMDIQDGMSAAQYAVLNKHITAVADYTGGLGINTVLAAISSYVGNHINPEGKYINLLDVVDRAVAMLKYGKFIINTAGFPE